MKLALLLPGYLDSPDYLHMKTFESGLLKMSYTVVRLDPCHLWETGNINNYSITNYIAHIKKIIDSYKKLDLQEVILIGHSLGGFVAIVAGSKFSKVTKIVALCSPPDRIGSAQDWNGKEYRHGKRELPDNPHKFREFDVPFSFAQDGIQYSAVESVKHMHKPLMLFMAIDDTVCPPELTEKIVANAHNPHVVHQANMGHDFRKSLEECQIVWNHIEKFITNYE